MSTSISSARYTDLYNYTSAAVQIDHDLQTQAGRLTARLVYFEANCRESGFRVSGDNLGGELRSYSSRALSVDERVRKVGEGFERADSRAGSFSTGLYPIGIGAAFFSSYWPMLSLSTKPTSSVETHNGVKTFINWLDEAIKRIIEALRPGRPTPPALGGANDSTKEAPPSQPQEPVNKPNSTRIKTVEEAEKHHFNQFQAGLEGWKATGNADCGPASLVMALEILGLKIDEKYETMPRGGALIHMRRSMVADANRDGVNNKGEAVASEHSTFTNFDDIERGAKSAGASYEELNITPDSFKQALESGGMIIASGTFTGKNPLPWTENRPGKSPTNAPGGATKHIIAIVGLTPEGKFIVNDPARIPPPMEVDWETLRSFMKDNMRAAKISVPQ